MNICVTEGRKEGREGEREGERKGGREGMSLSWGVWRRNAAHLAKLGLQPWTLSYKWGGAKAPLPWPWTPLWCNKPRPTLASPK